MDVDIGIKKNLQPQYTGKEMAVFLILNYLQNDKNEELFVSIDSIGYYLTGRYIDSQNDKNLVKGIKKGIEGLIKEDIIVLSQNKSNYIMDSQSCRIDTENCKFIIIKLWEIQAIFSSCGAYGFELLRFFVNIIGTINGKSKSWHMTQDDMSVNWGFSKKTINEYLCKLDELKLLYTFRSKARKVDNTFHRIGNVYGRYCDKEYVEKEGIQYLSTVPNRPIKDYFLNRTSIKLKYNNFLSGSKKYIDNPKLLYELYKDCVKYNKSLEMFPNEKISYLDLNAFKKYGFIISKNKEELCNGNDDWGEPDSLEDYTDNYSLEEILDMPIASEWRKEKYGKD